MPDWLVTLLEKKGQVLTDGEASKLQSTSYAQRVILFHYRNYPCSRPAAPEKPVHKVRIFMRPVRATRRQTETRRLVHIQLSHMMEFIYSYARALLLNYELTNRTRRLLWIPKYSSSFLVHYWIAHGGFRSIRSKPSIYFPNPGYD